MKYDTLLSVEIENRDGDLEEVFVPVEVDYTWENDGIGSYEYWGANCYDVGTDYVQVEGCTYDFDDFTEEEVTKIRACLVDKQEENYEYLADKIAKSCHSDFMPDPEYFTV